MIYAIDTNVLSALLNEEPNALSIATTLGSLRQVNSLCIHGSVYAELLASPGNTVARQNIFLARTAIQVDWATGEAVWLEAGKAYAAYARRRGRSGGGRPRRILADFLVGAHARLRAATLITLDDQHYQSAFPDLALLVP